MDDGKSFGMIREFTQFQDPNFDDAAGCRVDFNYGKAKNNCSWVYPQDTIRGRLRLFGLGGRQSCNFERWQVVYRYFATK